MTLNTGPLDVLIVGAGPAGLTAALVLARAGRSVTVLDGGPGRNAPAAHSHNVFTRDGAPPADLRRIGQEQAEGYGAQFIQARAVDAQADAAGVRVHLEDGQTLSARRLILATGVIDELPALPGLDQAWGETAVHCPYCHGYELKGRPTVVLGRGDTGFHQAHLLTGWTDQVTLLSNGPANLTAEQHEVLAEAGISVREDDIERLHVDDRAVQAVVFTSGERMPATALYLAPAQHLRGPLPDALNLDRTEAGHVATDELGRTSAPNVWACGDMTTPMQAVQMAASAGFAVAARVNHELIFEGAGFAAA